MSFHNMGHSNWSVSEKVSREVKAAKYSMEVSVLRNSSGKNGFLNYQFHF